MIVLQTLTLLVVACAMAFSLAHAAEMPGKMKLDKAQYFAVQKIYHPGFTIGGISEPLAIVALAALWFASGRAVLVAGSALLVAAMQVVYWFAVHPVNKVWLGGESLPRASAGFFGLGGAAGTDRDWSRLRKRWEYAHAVRACLSMLALLLVALHVAGRE